MLHEDKKYYPDADEVYPGVETMIQEEDTQAIHEPIVGTEKSKDFDLVEKIIPETTYNYEFMRFIMNNPELIRNVIYYFSFILGDFYVFWGFCKGSIIL